MKYLNNVNYKDCVGKVCKSKSSGDFKILKYNDIMQEIIHLKNENKSICQRIKYLRKKRIEYIKVITSNKGNKHILREYDKKIDSNVNLVILLTKLQKSNSKLIIKYRSGIRQLKNELV